MTTTLPLTPHQIRAVAVSAECHSDTVKRYLSGVRQSAFSQVRITRALRKLGYSAAIRAPQAPAPGTPNPQA